MKLEKELMTVLIDKLSALFSDDDEELDIISYDNFSEERQSNIVVVAIENSNSVSGHEGLNDFQLDMTITVDSFIADDKDGEKFFEIVNKVESYLDGFAQRNSDLTGLFDELPVVGLIYKNSQFGISTESNRVTIYYSVFASF